MGLASCVPPLKAASRGMRTKGVAERCPQGCADGVPVGNSAPGLCLLPGFLFRFSAGNQRGYLCHHWAEKTERKENRKVAALKAVAVVELLLLPSHVSHIPSLCHVPLCRCAQQPIPMPLLAEKLYNSQGPELRRSLFSLKQLFQVGGPRSVSPPWRCTRPQHLRGDIAGLRSQEDKDLVPEFVNLDGLTCLINVGAEADQNYQNYILRGGYLACPPPRWHR